MWILLLAALAAVIVVTFAHETPPTLSRNIAVVTFVVFNIGYIWVGIRRLHDINASAWWILVAIIPIANAVLALVLLFRGGTEGENRFGQDPAPNPYPRRESGSDL